jgi:hypothetical protein
LNTYNLKQIDQYFGVGKDYFPKTTGRKKQNKGKLERNLWQMKEKYKSCNRRNQIVARFILRQYKENMYGMMSNNTLMVYIMDIP